MFFKSRRKALSKAIIGLQTTFANEKWDLAYYGRGAQNPINATAQNIVFRELMLRGANINSFSADTANKPVVALASKNDYTHMLVKCWNPTWVSMYGQYLIIPLADYLPAIKCSQWTSKTRNTKAPRNVWHTEAGWKSTSTAMLNAVPWFGLWDTDGISPNSGGLNTVGTKTALALGNGFPGNYHYDEQAYFEIYLGKITDPLFFATEVDFQASVQKEMVKEVPVSGKNTGWAYTKQSGKDVLYIPNSNANTVELDPVRINAYEDFTLEWEGILGTSQGNNACIMGHWDNTGNAASGNSWLIYTRASGADINITFYIMSTSLQLKLFDFGVKAPLGVLTNFKVMRKAGIIRLLINDIKVGNEFTFNEGINYAANTKVRNTWTDAGDTQPKWISRMRVSKAAIGTSGFNVTPTTYLEHTFGYPNFGSSDFTIRARVKRTLNKSQIIVSRGSATNNNGTEWLFSVSAQNKLTFVAGIRNINSYVMYGEDILLDQDREYEVAVVRANGVTRLYVDGRQLKTYSNNPETTLSGIPGNFTTPTTMAFSIGTFLPDRSATQAAMTVRDLKITTRAEFNGDYQAGQQYISPLDMYDAGVLTSMPMNGVLDDYSATAKTFTVTGTASYNWKVKDKTAIGLNQFNYLERTQGFPNFGTSDFTIQARVLWFNGNESFVFGRASNTYNIGTEYTVSIDNAGRLMWYVGIRGSNNLNMYGTDVLAVSGKENHIAIVRKNGVTKLFMNGKEIKQFSNVSNGAANLVSFTTPTNMPVSIGSFVPVRNASKDCAVRDLRVSLTADYTGDFTPPVTAIKPTDSTDPNVLIAMPMDGNFVNLNSSYQFTATGTPTYSMYD